MEEKNDRNFVIFPERVIYKANRLCKCPWNRSMSNQRYVFCYGNKEMF